VEKKKKRKKKGSVVELVSKKGKRGKQKKKVPLAPSLQWRPREKPILNHQARKERGEVFKKGGGVTGDRGPFVLLKGGEKNKVCFR